VPDRFWTWTQHESPVASAFAGTERALDALRVDEGSTTWAAAVRAFRPELPYTPDEPLLATWRDDPWAGGAYSARSLASPLDDEALARSVGPIAFAGEHTAGPYHGLMEGALRSGVRAAGELVSRT
jgi:monoamine oxidase